VAPAQDSAADVLATKLRTLRKRQGLTQAQLGKLLHRRHPTVSDWERGKSLPTARDIKRYEEICQVTPGALLALFLKADEAVTASRRRSRTPRPLPAARAVRAVDSPTRPPARVLVIIDTSGAMRDDLNQDDPKEGTRINAARVFAADRLATMTQADRIGVWLMSSSAKSRPTHCTWVPRTHCVLQPLTDATEDVRTQLPPRIRSVAANAGATPLYETLELGVRELRRDRDNGFGSADAINTLIVITAGIESSGRSSANARTALAAAADGTAADRDNGVQILITAITPELCRTELKDAVLDLFAGACFYVGTKTAAVHSRRAIVDALRTRPGRPADGA
jgi:transcriptional regulator with XRE-family HTH domain